MTAAPLAEVAQRALTDEARANEWRVAVVRIVTYGATTLIAFASYDQALRNWIDILASAAILLLSIGLAVAVRRFYRPVLRFLIPALDAVFIAYLVGRRIELSGVTVTTGTSLVAAGGILAASGGLRFDRLSALWTTLLAIGVVLFLGGGWLGMGLPYVVAGLAGTGLLTMWQTDLVRRIIRGEQGRALMRSFLHDQVVDQAFTDPGALSVAPKSTEATVMVTDLRGFTALSEQLEPPLVVEVLNELHGALAEAVARHGGTVDKFMGDGMLAVFGAPEELPAHPLRALACAIDIRRAVAELNARHPDRKPLRLGVGVHTGPVVCGVIGGGGKVEFTVIGDTVNIAARLEAMTKELGVDLLLSENTARRSGAAPFMERGEVAVRGRSRPIRVCSVTEELRLPPLEHAPAPLAQGTA